MDELERAYREGSGNDIFTIKIDPILDDLRGQPRFEALIQKIFPPAAKRETMNLRNPIRRSEAE